MDPELERQMREHELARRARAWERMCPPQMREPWDWKRAECAQTDKVRAAFAWKWEKDNCLGLLLHGNPQLGKSRMSWSILKREHDRGVQVLAMDDLAFAARAVASFRDGEEMRFYDAMCAPAVLFIDDVGKAKMTARVAEGLFGVVKRRIEWQKPTVVTTNFTGESFRARIEDREMAEALHARLQRFFLDVPVLRRPK